MFKPKYIERFWLKVTTNPFWNGCDCWIWHGTVVSGGYGQYAVNLQRYRPHRFSWMLKNGPIPKGKMILHKCDNRLCVNPDHLYCGTHAENMRDRTIRRRTAKGEKTSGHKISANDVLHIRELRLNGWSTYKIWKSNPVLSYGAIKMICNRKTWKHI